MVPPRFTDASRHQPRQERMRKVRSLISFHGTVTGAPAAAYWGRVFLPGTYIPASAAVTCRERDFMPILASFRGSASLSALRFLPGSTSLSALRFPSQDRTSLQDAAHQIPPPVRCSAPRPVQPISSPRSHHPGLSVKVSIGLLSLFIAFEHVFVDILFCKYYMPVRRYCKACPFAAGHYANIAA